MIIPAVKVNNNVNKTGAVDKYFRKFSIKVGLKNLIDY
jgi:hypothetical protein